MKDCLHYWDHYNLTSYIFSPFQSLSITHQKYRWCKGVWLNTRLRLCLAFHILGALICYSWFWIDKTITGWCHMLANCHHHWLKHKHIWWINKRCHTINKKLGPIDATPTETYFNGQAPHKLQNQIDNKSINYRYLITFW